MREIETEKKEICEIHGEYISRSTTCLGLVFWTGCPACSAELDAEQLRQEMQALEKEKLERWEKCNIEPEYFNKSLDDYKPGTDSQRAALDAVKKIIAGDIKKLVLLGSNGLGKTMLGSMAVKELGGFIYSAFEIGLQVRGTYGGNGDEMAVLKRLASCPLLVIDEFDKAKNTENMQNILSYIIDKRHARNLPIIILSEYHLARSCKNNSCPECFEKLVNNAFVSRFMQNGEIIELNGKDWRAQNYIKKS